MYLGTRKSLLILTIVSIVSALVLLALAIVFYVLEYDIYALIFAVYIGCITIPFHIFLYKKYKEYTGHVSKSALNYINSRKVNV